MTTIEQHEVVYAIEPLTVSDICSMCNQQARWAVKLHQENIPMFFCFHHSYTVEAKIKELNPFAIRDERLEFMMNEEALKNSGGTSEG